MAMSSEKHNNIDFSQATDLKNIYGKGILERIQCFQNNGSLFPIIPDYFNILKVQKVNNPQLFGMYLFHKEELKNNGSSVTENILYHVTSPKIASKCIAKENIDWRLTQRSRFGIGACFAKCPIYAHEYANSKGAIVVCSVIVSNIEKVGINYDLNVPKDIQNDTTLSDDDHGGMVYVKYDDFTYYPKFIVFYGYCTNAPMYKQPRYPYSFYDKGFYSYNNEGFYSYYNEGFHGYYDDFSIDVYYT